MERKRVVSILKTLASGVDPLTNEPAHQAFTGMEVIRALFLAADWLANGGDPIDPSGARAAPPARRDKPRAAGMPWSEEEDLALAAEFDAGVTVSEMAVQHGRTRGGITTRLVKLGKIDPSSVKQRERYAPANAAPS